MLAAVDLYAANLPTDDPERRLMPDVRELIRQVPAERLDEDALAAILTLTMHTAAVTLRQVAEIAAPEIARAFADQKAVLDEMGARFDHVVNARTRANVKRGEATRRSVLEAKAADKSIAETARDLEISVSRVASIRGEAKRSSRV